MDSRQFDSHEHIDFPVPDQRSNVLATAVVDAALEVHRTLGPGFLENVYEDALSFELERRGIPLERQALIAVNYKGRRVGEGRIDLFVDRHLIVELKAVEVFAPVHMAQVVSYLRALRKPLGLLITFNVQKLRTGVRRVVVGRI
jgi:GxxExxY protein